MRFKTWLFGEELGAGEVDNTHTDNFAADDEFQEKIPQSRYRARDRKKVRSGFNPDKKFGHSPRYSRLK